MITTKVQLTGNSRTIYRDEDTIIGEVLRTSSTTGMDLYLALAHDWDGDSKGYDPIVVDTTDDREQAEAEIAKRYAAHLHSLRCHGITVTTTAEIAPEVAPTTTVGDRVTHATRPGVWTLEARYSNGTVHLVPDDFEAREYLASTHQRSFISTDELTKWVPPVADVDPAMADDPAMTPRMRQALRNLLDMEDSYAELAPTTQAVRANAHTMTALSQRGLVEAVALSAATRSLDDKNAAKLRRYRLTADGRGLAKVLEAKVAKIHVPNDPFAGIPTYDEDEL